MTNLPRRQLVAGFLVLGAELVSRDVLAQSTRLVKIGALTESWGPTPAVVGLRDGLQELGHREDKDFAIGVADLDIDLVPKRMEIFRELIPGLKQVLVPYDATNSEAVAQMAVHRDAARRLGLTLVERSVRGEEEARAAIIGLRKGEADGIVSLRFLTSNIPGFILEIARTPRRRLGPPSRPSQGTGDR